MSREDVMLNYFPHKDACPQDGKPCLKEKCKYWIEEKMCWYMEFGSIIEELFDCDDYSRFQLKDEQSWSRFFLKSELWLRDKEDFSKPPPLHISIGLNSYRLAEKLKEKFNLTEWKIEGRCEDGGDDHDLVMTTEAPFTKRAEIIKLLEDIRALIPKLIAEEDSINTCDLCKNHCESLTNHDKYSICYGCEQRIISENIPKYFK